MDRDSLLADAQWGATFREIEQMVGARLVSAERQHRWRPAWFCELERDGERVRVYFRGDRGARARRRRVAAARDAGAARARGARHSGVACVRLLRDGARHRHGDVAGAREPRHGRERGRAPRRARPLSRAARGDPPHRPRRVREARHAAAAHGRRAQPRRSARAGRAVYRRGKNQPEPADRAHARAGCARTCRRIATACRASWATRASSCSTAGASRRCSTSSWPRWAIPLADLGALFSRDLSEPLGDLSRGIARYRERTGETFERRDVLYQAVRFCIVTPLVDLLRVRAAAAGPQPRAVRGLEPRVRPRAARADRRSRGDRDRDARAAGAARPPTRDRVGCARRSARGARRRDPPPPISSTRRAAWREYAREIDRRGARLEEQDLDEAAELIGRRPASWREADAELERRAIAAGRDRASRARALPGSALAPARGTARTGTSRARGRVTHRLFSLPPLDALIHA